MAILRRPPPVIVQPRSAKLMFARNANHDLLLRVDHCGSTYCGVGAEASRLFQDLKSDEKRSIVAAHVCDVLTDLSGSGRRESSPRLFGEGNRLPDPQFARHPDQLRKRLSSHLPHNLPSMDLQRHTRYA
jgi:hypothetical protein